jgi:hypothetical protein
MRVYFLSSALHRDTYPRNEMQPWLMVTSTAASLAVYETVVPPGSIIQMKLFRALLRRTFPRVYLSFVALLSHRHSLYAFVSTASVGGWTSIAAKQFRLDTGSHRSSMAYTLRLSRQDVVQEILSLMLAMWQELSYAS